MLRAYSTQIVYYGGHQAKQAAEAVMTDERICSILEIIRVRAMAMMNRYAIPSTHREDLWDALQVEIIQRLGSQQFPSDACLFSYANHILRSRIIDYSRRRRSPIEKAMGASHDAAIESLTGGVADTTTELNDLLTMASQRDARLLRLYADGNTYEQIAVLENRSASQIRRRVSATIRQLKAKVSEQ